MIVCSTCGNQNPDGTEFCSSCGSFLEWERPEVPAETAEATSPGLEGATGVLTEPAEDRSGGVAAPPSDVPVPAPPSPAPATPSSIARPAATAPRAAPPPTAPAPSDDQPGAVLPGQERVRPAPRVVEAPAEEVRPGDLVCPQCGIGNDPSRRFCRRCGAILATAAVAPPAKVPWWRRIFRRRSAPAATAPSPAPGAAPAAAAPPVSAPAARPAPAAAPRGPEPSTAAKAAKAARKARSGALSLRSKVFRVLGILAVLGIVAVAAVPPWREAAVDRVSDLFSRARQTVAPKFVPINSIRASSPSRVQGHFPIRAIDGNIATSWWTRDAGVGTAITISFEEPSTVGKVIFTIGNQESEVSFRTHPVPRRVRMVFLDAQDRPVGEPEEIALQRVPDPQVFDLASAKAAAVRLEILEVYAALEGSSANMAIAEVEFFRKE